MGVSNVKHICKYFHLVWSKGMNFCRAVSAHPAYASANMRRITTTCQATGYGGFLFAGRKLYKLAKFMAVRYCKVTTNCQLSDEHHDIQRGAFSLA